MVAIANRPDIKIEYESPQTRAASVTASGRLVSLDAFRGLAMVLMASAGLSISTVAKSYPQSPTWQFLGWHTDHTHWTGCSLWDLIQSSFMFMVGAAVPFSIASRRAKGHGFWRLAGHAAWRSVALVLLGVFLLSYWRAKQTNWTFTTVLPQIGLGYFFLFLLAWVRPRWQIAATVAILFVYWLTFALYPATPAGFDFAKVNATLDGKPWPYAQHGFGAHWDINTNAGAAFDLWFLSKLPREKTFIGEEGGYVTLNFVPSLATMVLGLLAGGLLMSPTTSSARKVAGLTAAGIACLAVGYALHATNICPMVKRIWTPSWTIFSAGWAFVGLAFFYAILDVARVRFWAFPLTIVGMNSIAVYVMSQTGKPLIRDTIRTHLGQDIFDRAANKLGGPQFTPMVITGTVLLVLWLVTLWMYRRRIFLKI